jgi:hypothetical protein
VGCDAKKLPAGGDVFFLDFSLYRTYQDLARILSGAWSGITVPSHAPNDPKFRQKLFI